MQLENMEIKEKHDAWAPLSNGTVNVIPNDPPCKDDISDLQRYP